MLNLIIESNTNVQMKIFFDEYRLHYKVLKKENHIGKKQCDGIVCFYE